MRDLLQGCAIHKRQVARANKLCMVAPNICGSSVCNLLHVTVLARRILRWLLDFLGNLCSTDLLYKLFKAPDKQTKNLDCDLHYDAVYSGWCLLTLRRNV